MAQQVETKNRPISVVVGSAAFQIGVADFQASKPLNVDAFKYSNDQWNYERGRLYAASCAARGEVTLPSRIGRRINADALWHYHYARERRDVL